MNLGLVKDSLLMSGPGDRANFLPTLVCIMVSVPVGCKKLGNTIIAFTLLLLWYGAAVCYAMHRTLHKVQILRSVRTGCRVSFLVAMECASQEHRFCRPH